MNHLINNLITVLNRLGGGFCDFAGSMLIQSGVLIVLLLIVDFLIRKRVRATFRYWIWMLVLLKLILPPAFSLPTGFGYWLGGYLPAQPSVSNQAANMTLPEPAGALIIENSSITDEIPHINRSRVIPEPAAPAIPVTFDFQTFTWQAVIFVIWFIGAAVLSVLLIHRILFVRRLINLSKLPENRYADMLDQCCKQLGLKRKTKLRLAGKLQSPAVCGFFKPVILMPTGLPEKLSTDRLKAVLIHELAHIKRGDIWVNCVQTFLQILYFYNPLLWVANTFIRRIREQAVDEMVLVALGGRAKSYSNTLIDIAEMSFLKTSLSLRFIGVVESKKALNRRIQLMFNRPIPKNTRLGILGLLTLLILGAVLLPMARAKKQSIENAGVNPDAQSKYVSETTKVDIAIEDKDLIVTKLSDRLFEALIPIRNRGPVPLPRFKVYFYAGDPDKGGRLLSAQNAGPIMPGGSWLEGTHPHRLEPGEDMISVVLDPDNIVKESNETNNKASQTLAEIASESEKVRKIVKIQRFDLSGDDILQVEARASEGFNFPYYLFIPGGIDKESLVYLLVEPNNSGMVSDDPEVHQAKALTLVKRSYANRMARRLGVPLLVPTFPRPRPETHSWAYTHALDIDTLEIQEGKLKRVDLQLTAMIKNAQELLRTNGFAVNDRIFIHGFSASAKFCNRYSYLHPEMVKAAAAGGVNGLPTLPVREWNGYELPFPIGIAGIERFTDKPFDEKAFRLVAHYIYMGSNDKNDTLLSPEAWRKEEADIIRKALAAEKMMPDRWELSRKIYRQQKLHAQLVTYNGVGHSIQSQMLDDVIEFFKANAGKKYVPIKPYEYPVVEFKKSRPGDETTAAKIDVKPENFDIRLDKNRGTCSLVVLITNQSSLTLPRFKMRFYRGDPGDNLDEAGNVHEGWHGAGPVEPGKSWGEGTRDFHLPDGQYDFSVFLDCDNSISEIDENNNRAELKVKIENGKIAEKSVSCPSIPKNSKTNERDKLKEVFAGSKIPPEMVGTWIFDNPHGDEEQMAVFPDGRVVVLYSNGHKDQTNLVDGYIELAEYKNARCRMAVREDGTLVQYFGQKDSSGKQWRRISPEPHTNLLGALSDSWGFKGKYLAKLSHDVTVDLVGVCDWAKEEKRCWRPDGSKSPVEVYASKWNIKTKADQYGFIYKVVGPEDIKVSCRINGASQTEGSCKVVDGSGNQLKDITASVSDMEKGRLSTTVRIGVAAGPWETIASHDGRRMTTGRQGDVLWSQAFQSDSGTHIIASREWQRDRDGRIIVIDKDGKTHATRNSGSVSSGKILQRTSNFRNLNLEKIKKFQYQIRPFQWVEFKNVSLKPGLKTDVGF